MIQDRNTFAKLMFILLSKEAEKWSWCVKSTSDKQIKYRHNLAHNSIKALIKELEKNWPQEIVDEMEDLSEIFSRCLELMHKANTRNQKEELFLIMKDYSEGQLEVRYDDTVKTKPVEL